MHDNPWGYFAFHIHQLIRHQLKIYYTTLYVSLRCSNLALHLRSRLGQIWKVGSLKYLILSKFLLQVLIRFNMKLGPCCSQTQRKEQHKERRKERRGGCCCLLLFIICSNTILLLCIIIIIWWLHFVVGQVCPPGSSHQIISWVGDLSTQVPISRYY